MKTIFIVASVILLSACQSDVSELSNADREIIQNSSAEWVNTYNRNDWKALAELFTTNAVMMPPNSSSAIGRDEISTWQAENESGFSIAFDILEIEGARDIAYVQGRSCVFIPIGDEKVGVDVGKFLEVRERQEDGQWLIKMDIFNSDASIGSELSENCPFATLESL